MWTSNLIARAAFIVLIATSSLAFAQQQPPPSAGKTCEAFVKDFYDWYLRTDRAHSIWPYDLVMKAKPPVLGAELLSGLRAVDAEAAKEQDPGLDFEPILNTQDPGDTGDPPYLVRDVKEDGKVCHADVYNQWNGKTEKIVIPELRAENGRWIFTNFRYPNLPNQQGADLLSMIKRYLKPSKEAPKHP